MTDKLVTVYIHSCTFKICHFGCPSILEKFAQQIWKNLGNLFRHGDADLVKCIIAVCIVHERLGASLMHIKKTFDIEHV